MFDNLFGNKQIKMQEESEKRQINASKEISSFNAGAQEGQTEIYNSEGKSDLIKWQQDLNDELMDLAYELTGWIKKEGVWVRTDKQPLCNDRFMNDVVMPQCKPYISRIYINSNLQEERILNMLRNTSDEIADNMADGYDIYGIDFINFDLVLRLIKNTITSSAFRALNGWTKRLDSTIMKRIESSIENSKEQQKKGLFGIGG